MKKITEDRIDAILTNIFKNAQAQRTPAWYANRENWKVDLKREDYAKNDNYTEYFNGFSFMPGCGEGS